MNFKLKNLNTYVMCVSVSFSLQIKAAIRTVNPREEKLIPPEEKFKIAVNVLIFHCISF